MISEFFRARTKTARLVYVALFVGIVAAVTALIAIPMPKSGGFLNFGDGIIFFAAYLLGGVPAAIVGGLGSCFADLMLGYTAFAPFTLVTKGLEGLVAGAVFWMLKTKNKKAWQLLLVSLFAEVLGGLFMVAGYFFTSWLLFDLPAATIEVLLNLVQLAFGAAVGSALVLSFWQMQKQMQRKKPALAPGETPGELPPKETDNDSKTEETDEEISE